MTITFNPDSPEPIYLQIVNSITKQIESATLPGGYQLPTLRELTAQTGISQGTIKHAYDILEQSGLIHKTQGRGTFVCDVFSRGDKSKKDQALAAIDSLLDRMEELSFSAQETRIFLDLKLREREENLQAVRIAAVDCSPEALHSMIAQLSTFTYVDSFQFLLQPILDSTQTFTPDVDIAVTTPTHLDQLQEKLPPDMQLIPAVMALSSATVLQLARIKKDQQVGIICQSDRFCSLVQKACKQYCILSHPPTEARFGELNESFFKNLSAVIVPQGYLQFASQDELDLIQKFKEKSSVIQYEYNIQKGSLLYIEQQLEHIYKLKSQRM